MNTRMTGGSVRDHCLKMMSHLNQAEVLGMKLEQRSQIDFIFESLPDRFTQFKVNYNMNKMDLTPTVACLIILLDPCFRCVFKDNFEIKTMVKNIQT